MFKKYSLCVKACASAASLWRTLTLLLAALLVAPAATALESVTVQLLWKHQFEFAGYYAALHNGFYRDAGLAVTIKEGGPNISPIDEVIQGRAQFGVSDSSLMYSYLGGQSVLMLAPIFQHSPAVLLTLGKQLTTPSDVATAGLIQLKPGYENMSLKAMFISEGITLDKLKIVNQGVGLEDLLAGRIVAMVAYLSNEPFLLQQRGIPYSIIKPNSYGMDFYDGVLFTRQFEEQARPESVAAFRAATLKGWEYALAHPDEIIDLILANYNTQGKTTAHLAFEAQTLTALINPDLIEIGHSNVGRWKHIASVYADKGMLTKDASIDGFLYQPQAPLNWPRILPYLMAGLALLAVMGLLVAYIARTNRKLTASFGGMRRAQEAAVQVYTEQRQFIAMIAHELRTPLAVIGTAIANLQARIQGDQPDLQPRFARIDTALARLNTVVDKALDEQRLSDNPMVFKPKPTAPSALLAQVRSLISVSDKHPLHITASTNYHSVPMDLHWIALAVVNLIDNAVK